MKQRNKPNDEGRMQNDEVWNRFALFLYEQKFFYFEF